MVSGVGNGNGGWDGDRVGHVALALSEPGVRGWWKEMGDQERLSRCAGVVPRAEERYVRLYICS